MPPTIRTSSAASISRPRHYLGFSAQSRFDHETFDIKRTDLWHAPPITVPAQLQVNYAKVTSEPGLALDQPRQEIVAAGVLALTTDWSLLGNIRYDLETDQTITDGLGSAVPERLLDGRP